MGTRLEATDAVVRRVEQSLLGDARITNFAAFVGTAAAKGSVNLSPKGGDSLRILDAHTLAWLEVVAQDLGRDYEVQRLAGMGDAVHQAFHQHQPRPTRLYAPIGEFSTLLPYLVRRLLENGSSQSFVNQLANPQIDSQWLVRDPVTLLSEQPIAPNEAVEKASPLTLEL